MGSWPRAWVRDSQPTSVLYSHDTRGKHRCMMMGMKNPQDRGVTTIAEKCPYCPLTPLRIVLPDFVPTAARAIFARVIAHRSPNPQTAARFRISFDCTRQKRGPPS